MAKVLQTQALAQDLRRGRYRGARARRRGPCGRKRRIRRGGRQIRSGKSTLLHMLGGLTAPTDGHYVDGNDIFALKDDELTIFAAGASGSCSVRIILFRY